MSLRILNYENKIVFYITFNIHSILLTAFLWWQRLLARSWSRIPGELIVLLNDTWLENFRFCCCC